MNDLFSSYSENDEQAMVFVNMYIAKAKREQRFSKLIAGYEEAQFYSKSTDTKIKYADSAVAAAIRSKDEDLIATSYLKRGIIHYYNRRDYRRALKEYLSAFKNAKNTNDLYLYNKILYHLGMVKSYLGLYQEAVVHFTETAGYYEKHMSDQDHQNVRSNYEHGYLNSIYRLSTCYRKLLQYRQEDSLIGVGKKRVVDTEEFSLEFAYFEKAQGIQCLRNGKDAIAEDHLLRAEDILKRNQDFAALATVDFYIGKLKYKDGKKGEAIKYFKKVDSIIDQYNFVTPEIIDNYKFLIHYAKEDHNGNLQLYYTNKLLRADSIVRTDFAALSSDIIRGYDVDVLVDDRDELVRKHEYGSTFLIGIIVCGLLGFYFFLYRSREKEKDLTKKYGDLLEKLMRVDEEGEETTYADDRIKSIYNDQVIEVVKRGLKIFEEERQFLDKDLKLPDVAALINSNRSIVSFVLNEHFNITFSEYIKRLRIQYITKKLLEERIYLKYSMDTLVAECGMKNRQVFSNHFLQINGIRPKDFVRKRLEELEKS
ncbi:hypothetical protein IO90_10590 [Chryseobacterium sp. FH1]|nr:hypothetical protein IO90_10590 [Chryseobacterium sp. FH1]